MVDLIYGRQRTLRKFIVLEIVARVPYQAWERAAYGALTRVHPRLRLAGRIFERVVETRAQQDNEQFHLLILEELAQRHGLARPVLRFRLLPWLMAVGYYQLSWLLYICWPAVSYRLNAAFEDHAEHDYMLFVTEHPEWEAQPYDGSFQAGSVTTDRSPTCSARSGTTSGCTSWKASPPWTSRDCGTTCPPP